MKKITADDFREALRRRFFIAWHTGKNFVEVNSGDLHREVGIYPNPGHSMPTCCNVMRQAMTVADTVLSEPPKGRGATLTIRYELPRNAA
jgi:5-methylcytosine-specific restriction protein A